MFNKLLDVQNLTTSFKTSDGLLTAVNKVSFYANDGEILGIVGESGCGKSVTALSIMDLIPKSAGIVQADSMIFNGENILGKSKNEMRLLRGNKISMIFQEPMTSLNPVFTIEFQLVETLMAHIQMTRSEAIEHSRDIIEKVGISLPDKCLKSYPHELSGGMRQRIMIAMALLCNPKLLIADEPTTALDVTIQAQILDLMKKLRDDFNMTIMFITHDLGVIAEMCERVIVMYAGQIVEQASTVNLFRHPQHPYTNGLLNSIPRLERTNKRLNVIEGVVPDIRNFPKGCKFAPRCPHAMNICYESDPPLSSVSFGHDVSCWLFTDKGKIY